MGVQIGNDVGPDWFEVGAAVTDLTGLSPSERADELQEQVAQLQTALVHREVIAEALGMVRGRYGLDHSRAWDVLRRVSSHTNTKLRDIAVEMVVSGSMPPQLRGAFEVTGPSAIGGRG